MRMQVHWYIFVLCLAPHNGGVDVQVDCQVGEVNAEGLRGVRAQRDMQQHQVAVKLPKVMAITLKEWNKTSEVCARPPCELHQAPCADKASARKACRAWSSWQAAPGMIQHQLSWHAHCW